MCGGELEGEGRKGKSGVETAGMNLAGRVLCLGRRVFASFNLPLLQL